MREPYACSHPDAMVTLRRRVIGGGTTVYAHQCERCGRLVGKWVKKERVTNPDALPEWNDDLATRWQKGESEYAVTYRKWRVSQVGVEAFAKVDDTANERLTLFRETYSGYLNSEPWRIKRSIVMRRADGVCEGCGVNNATQVHHLTYDRVGKEMLFDLVAICESCHKSIHGAE